MKKIPIIGIGASAGGLKEFESFFKNMPSSKDAAFVIIQHLSPNYKSILADIVNRYTEMDVSRIEDEMVVEPGKVYIIPPNKLLTLDKGKLCLSPMKKEHGIHLPIDVFFRSLKDNLKEKAVAVILSGTGSDGTLGIKEVKEAGGLTIVQQPDTADYDGMPLNAIKTGLIDFVIPVSEMPGVILSYIENEFQEHKIINTNDKKTDNCISKIFDIVKGQTGNDFTLYKRNTIYRRLERRLTVNKMTSLKEYLHLLENNSTEVGILYKEFLISVTGFFRDIDTFKYFETKIIPQIVSRAKDSVRIWIPACATGEEAYSWAMMFKKYMDDNKLNIELQVFASDIDVDAIDKAREGLYTNNIAADVPADLLDRYFVKEKEGIRIKKSIRESVIFAEQNLVQDPPYSRLDMVSCRNLLIYLDNELQQKAITIAHYALNTDGILVLGNSESLGNSAQYFKVLDKKFRIFQKVDNLEVSTRVWKLNYEKQQEKSTIKQIEKTSISDIAKEFILERHTPPSVVINKEGEMIYAQGRTGKFLEIATGEITTNILKIAREGLKMPISNALRKAKTNNKEVIHKNLRVKTNGDYEYIDLTVAPLSYKQKETKLFMVLFTPVKHISTKHTDDKEQSVEHLTIYELEKELAEKEQYLQHTIEELETTNEELKTSNEEAQSTNEELQSANEELETSKEELQSVNEELTITNNELSLKIEELNVTNSRIKNLLTATDIATIFLDKELRISSFTPAVSIIIDLLHSDVGRSIKQFTNNLKYNQLINDTKDVLKTLIPKEIEVQNTDDRFFWMRIIPYRTIDDKIEGVVITFTDITEKKKDEAELERHRNHLEELVEEKSRELAESEKKFRNITENIPGLVLRYKLNNDGSDELLYLSKNVEEVYEIPHKEAVNNVKLMWERIYRGDLDTYIQTIEKSNKELSLWETEHRIQMPDGRIKWLHARGVPTKQEDGSIIWDTIGVDITERKNSEQKLLINQHYLKKSQEIGTIGTWHLDIEKNILTWTEENYKIFGIAPDSPMKYELFVECIHPDDRKYVDIEWKKAIENNSYDIEHRLLVNGKTKWVREKAEFVFDDNEKAIQAFGVTQDITARKNKEQALKESEEKYKTLVNHSPDIIYKFSNKKGGLFWSDVITDILGYTHNDIKENPNLWNNSIHPDDKESVQQAIEDNTKGVDYNIEYRIKTKEGNWIWLHDQFTHKEIIGDEIIIEGHAGDITAGKKAEQALKESEALLRRTEGITHIGSWEWNIETDTITWSDELFKIFNVDKEEGIGSYQGHKKIYPDKSQDILDKLVHNALNKGEAYEAELEFNRTLTETGLAKIYGFPQKNKDAKVVKLYGSVQDITERKKAEQYLKESEEKFRTIFENGLSATVIADDKGNYISANNAAAELFGYSVGELQKMNVADLNTSIKPGTAERYNKYLERGEESGEFDFITKNGDKKIAIYRAVRIKPDFNLSVLFDITDSKRAEQALKESEANFKSIIENSTNVFYKHDINHKLTYISPQIYDLLGYEPEEAKRQWTEMVTDNPINKIGYRNTIRAIETGKSQDMYVLEALHKDGYKVWIEVREVPIVKNGKTLEIVGALTDITKRKKAEQELLINRHHLKKAQEIGIIGSWNIDLKTKDITWTEEMYKIFGIKRDKLLSIEIIFNSVHPDDRERVEKGMQNTFTGKQNEDEFRIIVSNEVKWIRVKAILLFDDNGNAKQAVGVAQDITNKKAIENKLIKQAEELQQLNTDKDRFISVLAHDLKNPFNNLLGFSNLLVKNARKYDIEKIEKQAKIINTTARRTFNMLDEILLWSRANSGKISYKPVQIKLKDLCSSVIETASNHSASKQISVKCNIQDDFTIYTDYDITKTIFRNLFSNAVKYTKSKGAVTIKAKKTNKETIVSISDTGVGMTKELLSNLFNSSAFETEAGTANEKGSGFGLQICKEFVNKIGGRIWAESELEKGSVFYFSIPDNYEISLNTALNSENPSHSNNSNKKYRILIAEDEIVNFEFLEILIKEEIGLNCEILHAKNGQEAVEIANNTETDLILMDIKMPVMDGFEATRQIKSFKPELKVIIQSANAEQKNIDKATALGCVDFLSKPITAETLENSLNKQLKIGE